MYKRDVCARLPAQAEAFLRDIHEGEVDDCHQFQPAAGGFTERDQEQIAVRARSAGCRCGVSSEKSLQTRGRDSGVRSPRVAAPRRDKQAAISGARQGRR